MFDTRAPKSVVRYKNETSADLFPNSSQTFNNSEYGKHNNDFYQRDLQKNPVQKSEWKKNDSSNIFMSINNTTPRHLQKPPQDREARTPPPRTNMVSSNKEIQVKGGNIQGEYLRPASSRANERTPIKNASTFNREYNYSTPKRPQEPPKKDLGQYEIRSANSGPFEDDRASISSSTSTVAQNMICDLCVNKQLMEEKILKKMMEKEQEELFRRIAETNHQQQRKEEQLNAFRKKEEGKKMGNVLMNQMLDKSEKKQEEKRLQNQPIEMNIGGEGDVLYQEMNRRQKNLRSELITQIRKKELDREYEKVCDDGEQGLKFGEGVRNRSAYENMHYVDQLKRQMEERAMKQEDEKYEDKRYFAHQNKLNKREEEEAKKKSIEEEKRRKNGYKDFILTQIEAKKAKMEQEKDEDNRYKEVFAREADQMQMDLMDQKHKKREQEVLRLNTLKNQMQYKEIEKKIEKQNDKIGAIDICPHKSKLYACSICSRKVPKSQLSKNVNLRSVTPTKF